MALIVIALFTILGGKNVGKQAEKQIQNINLPPTKGEFVLVKDVSDGDTITTTIDGKDAIIRLIGVDTPETKDPRRPVQCFGQQASQKTTEWMLNQYVKLVSDSVSGDKDIYDRYLRYVYREDGLFLNKALIEEGYGFEYTFRGEQYDHQAEFKQAQKDAEAGKRGLWSPLNCNGKKQ